ncbi:MAG: hypothetical protein MJZ23_05010 [Paludibacteraceae bacterium]|nr:hypothetical protein [Paludibacteraceae bacterium]
MEPIVFIIPCVILLTVIFTVAFVLTLHGVCHWWVKKRSTYQNEVKTEEKAERMVEIALSWIFSIVVVLNFLKMASIGYLNNAGIFFVVSLALYFVVAFLWRALGKITNNKTIMWLCRSLLVALPLACCATLISELTVLFIQFLRIIGDPL